MASYEATEDVRAKLLSEYNKAVRLRVRIFQTLIRSWNIEPEEAYEYIIAYERELWLERVVEKPTSIGFIRTVEQTA